MTAVLFCLFLVAHNVLGSTVEQSSAGVESDARVDQTRFRKNGSVDMSRVENVIPENEYRSHASLLKHLNNRLNAQPMLKSMVSLSSNATDAEAKLNLSVTPWPVDEVSHYNCLTAVRRQHAPNVSGCGSCWAHGSVGGLEMPLCVAKQPLNDDQRNKLTDFSYETSKFNLSLSVQEIVDCTSADNNVTNDDDNIQNHACHGGEVLTAWNLLMQTGLRSDTVFPGQGDHWDNSTYKTCAEYRISNMLPALLPKWFDKTMHVSKPTIVIGRLLSDKEPRFDSEDSRLYKLADYVVYPNVRSVAWPDTIHDSSAWPQIPEMMNEWIKMGIRKKGGVVVAILVTNEYFLKWRHFEEIYFPPEVECIGERDAKTGLFTKFTNHNVIVTGYGVDNGVRYFKIKNSWSTTFGVKGYFRVAADHCQKFVGLFGPGSFFKTPTIAVIEQI